MWHGKSGSPCQHGSFPKWWNVSGSCKLNLIRKLHITDYETNWLVYNEIPVSITHLTAYMNINDHLNLKLQAVHCPFHIHTYFKVDTCLPQIKKMSEKRPNFGLDEGKLKLDGSASGTVANQETLKPSRGKGKRKRNQGRYLWYLQETQV